MLRKLICNILIITFLFNQISYASEKFVDNVPSSPGKLILHPGGSLYSYGGTVLKLNTDGVLTATDKDGHEIWSSESPGDGTDGLYMSDMGSLYILDKNGEYLFSTSIIGKADHVGIKDNGNLVIYNSINEPIWSMYGVKNNPIEYDVTNDTNKDLTLEYAVSDNKVVSRTPLWSTGTVAEAHGLIKRLREKRIARRAWKKGKSLRAQYDGNLVLYNNDGKAVWASNTFGKNTLCVQNDGNLVVYSSNRTPLWSSGTSQENISPGQDLCYSMDDKEILTTNESIDSSNEMFSLNLQGDGNLVLYRLNRIDPENFEKGYNVPSESAATGIIPPGDTRTLKALDYKQIPEDGNTILRLKRDLPKNPTYLLEPEDGNQSCWSDLENSLDPGEHVKVSLWKDGHALFHNDGRVTMTSHNATCTFKLNMNPKNYFFNTIGGKIVIGLGVLVAAVVTGGVVGGTVGSMAAALTVKGGLTIAGVSAISTAAAVGVASAVSAAGMASIPSISDMMTPSYTPKPIVLPDYTHSAIRDNEQMFRMFALIYSRHFWQWIYDQEGSTPEEEQYFRDMLQLAMDLYYNKELTNDGTYIYSSNNPGYEKYKIDHDEEIRKRIEKAMEAYQETIEHFIGRFNPDHEFAYLTAKGRYHNESSRHVSERKLS